VSAPADGAGAGERPSTADFLRYWLPAAAYVGLIFSLSTIRGTDIPSPFPNVDKLAHLLEYSLLGLLLGRAIRFTLAGRGRAVAAVGTIVAGAMVGLADELYQRGIPGRSCDVRDWIVDVSAVSLSVLFTQWVSTRSLRGRGGATKGESTR
jgi:VanZ family protein